MARHPDTPRNLAIGCFMTPLGALSGGMVGVLLSKIVASLTNAPTCPDIPTCDWHVYAGWGMLAGGLTLPALVLSRLFGGKRDDTIDPNRG
jgi:hypothetical protein